MKINPIDRTTTLFVVLDLVQELGLLMKAQISQVFSRVPWHLTKAIQPCNCLMFTVMHFGEPSVLATSEHFVYIHSLVDRKSVV